MRAEQLNVSILIFSINLGFGIRSAAQQLVWNDYSLHEFLILILHSLLQQAVAAAVLFVLINIKALSEYVDKIASFYTKQPNSLKLALLGLTFLYIVKHNGVLRILVVSLVSAKAYGQLFNNSKVIKVVNKMIDKTGLSTIKKSKKATESHSLLQRHDYPPSSAKTPVSINRISNVRGVTPRTDLVSKRLFNDNDYIDTKKTRQGVSFYNNSLRTNEKLARKPRSTPYHKQSSQEHSSRNTVSSETDTRARSPIVEPQEPGITKSTHDDRGYNAYTELVQPLMATSGKAFNYAKEYSTNIFSSLSSFVPAPSQNVTAAGVSESMDIDQIEASPQKVSTRKRPNTESVSPSKRTSDKSKSKQSGSNEKEIETSKPNDKSVTFTDAEISPKNARTETATYAGRSSNGSSITSIDTTDSVELRRNNSTSSTASTISFSGLNSDGLNVGIAHKRRKAVSSFGYTSISDQSSLAKDDFVMRRKFAENLVTTEMNVNKSDDAPSSDQVVTVAMHRAPIINSSFAPNPAPEISKNKKEELIDDGSNAAPKSSGLSIFTDSTGSAAVPAVPSADVTKPTTDASTIGKIERVESAIFPLLDDVASTNKPASVSAATAPVPTVSSIFPEYSPNKNASLPNKVSPSKKPPPSPVVAGGEVPGIAFNSSLGKSSVGHSTQAVEVVPSAASSIFGGASSGVSTSQLPPLALPPTQAPAQRVNLFGNDVSASSTNGATTADNTAGSGITGILSAAASATKLPNAGGFNLVASNSAATPAAVASTTTISGVSGVPSAGGFSFGGAAANTATPAAASTNSAGFILGGAAANTATPAAASANSAGFSFGGAAANTATPAAASANSAGFSLGGAAANTATPSTNSVGFSLGGTSAPITSSTVTNTSSGMPPATNTAFSLGGASAPANPTGAAGGIIGASTTNPSTVGSTSIFGGGSSAAFGSASTAASSVTAPASNLFGSAPSAVPSIPSVPSFGATAPATSAAPFTFGATAQGSSIASTNSNTVAPAPVFGGSASGPFGSTSTISSSVAAPASNLFGSASSAVPSIPSVPSFGAMAPATSAAPFTFGATAQGSSIASSTSTAPALGFNQASSTAATSQGALMFGGSASDPFGSTSTASSSIAAPASNLFGSAPSAMPSVPSVPSFGAMAPATSAAPFTFGATAQGGNFMGSQNQPPNPGIMSAPAGGMFSLGTVDKRTNLKAKKK